MGRDVSMMPMHQDWDIFCRVIDNYGDIGVCWRLARQLVREHGKTVRLWVDDLPSLSAICPEALPDVSSQQVAGVRICHWRPDFVTDSTASVVIEAFACELPPDYIAAMAQRPQRPCWINLEYLTAEAWADGCHGMASPHPELPLVKHFFFPGFTRLTGGLLRESHIPGAQLCAASEPLTISLFCYETAPVDALLSALAAMPIPVRCLVTPGKPLAAVRRILGGDGPWQSGLARIEAVPFRPMDDYDDLLRSCDLNFVRGEDSFVRGQLAGKPMVWHIYPQDEDAHLVKLDAFLERYCSDLPGAEASAIRMIFHAWNHAAPFPPAWNALIQEMPAIRKHAVNWQNSLKNQPDLAGSLVKFCADKV